MNDDIKNVYDRVNPNAENTDQLDNTNNDIPDTVMEQDSLIIQDE